VERRGEDSPFDRGARDGTEHLMPLSGETGGAPLVEGDPRARRRFGRGVLEPRERRKLARGRSRPSSKAEIRCMVVSPRQMGPDGRWAVAGRGPCVCLFVVNLWGAFRYGCVLRGVSPLDRGPLMAVPDTTGTCPPYDVVHSQPLDRLWRAEIEPHHF
jgi:hypothetical protein